MMSAAHRLALAVWCVRTRGAADDVCAGTDPVVPRDEAYMRQLTIAVLVVGAFGTGMLITRCGFHQTDTPQPSPAPRDRGMQRDPTYAPSFRAPPAAASRSEPDPATQDSDIGSEAERVDQDLADVFGSEPADRRDAEEAYESVLRKTRRGAAPWHRDAENFAQLMDTIATVERKECYLGGCVLRIRYADGRRLVESQETGRSAWPHRAIWLAPDVRPDVITSVVILLPPERGEL
jgi:hypothetical protein